LTTQRTMTGARIEWLKEFNGMTQFSRDFANPDANHINQTGA